MFSFDDFWCYIVILPTFDESFPVISSVFFDEFEVDHEDFIFLLSSRKNDVLKFEITMEGILSVN